MPRVTTHTANKDHPKFGIKKGDKYYAWKRKIGPASGIEFKSLTYPRPSQLNTGFRGQLGDIELDMGKADSPDALREFAEQLRELGEECGSSFDNMPEGLQQGETGQLLEERRDGCEAWADEVEQAADEWQEKLDALEPLRQEWVEYDAAYAEYEEEQAAFDDADEEEQAKMEEPTEPDEPGEERPDEEAEGELQSEYVQQALDANPGL